MVWTFDHFELFGLLCQVFGENFKSLRLFILNNKLIKLK